MSEAPERTLSERIKQLAMDEGVTFHSKRFGRWTKVVAEVVALEQERDALKAVVAHMSCDIGLALTQMQNAKDEATRALATEQRERTRCVGGDPVNGGVRVAEQGEPK